MGCLDTGLADALKPCIQYDTIITTWEENKMKHTIKRMLAMLLASLTLLSELTLTAAAETYSGRYDGNYYTTRLTAAERTTTAKMTYEGSEQIRATGIIHYKQVATGATFTAPLTAPGAYSVTSKTETFLMKFQITSVHENYYIGNTCVEVMGVVV